MHTNRIPALFALVAAVALVACERAQEDPATSSPPTGYDVPFARRIWTSVGYGASRTWSTSATSDAFSA